MPRFFDRIHRIPLIQDFYPNVPALPFEITDILRTIPLLAIRSAETIPAKNGLSTLWTIDGRTASAHSFLFGESPTSSGARHESAIRKAAIDHPDQLLKLLAEAIRPDAPQAVSDNPPGDLTTLTLDDPKQWSMAWTTYLNVSKDAQPLLPDFAATFTSADAATAAFWPTIATYGLGYNLIVANKLGAENAGEAKEHFAEIWSSEHERDVADGVLYAIDMMIFEQSGAVTVDGFPRFTPATYTLLRQDPATKSLTPIAIRVSGGTGSGNGRTFTRSNATDGAWLYALQAAKTSVTVYGIWLGHVYHWHIVTAAMQMTMYNTFQSDHPIRQLLEPQSQYLIGFDDVLMLLWGEIAPPTSAASVPAFLSLINAFANQRPFAADNPKRTLADLGVQESDFTIDDPWDAYPIVGTLLRVWDAAETYCRAFVEATYPDDAAVANDAALRSWIAASSDPREGNVQGLPAVTSREILTEVLASLIYRITAHGVARLNATANPGLTFVGNYPPCLQDAAIPAPSEEIDLKRLLQYMPRTGTIGKMVTFYFIFVFSSPYEPFVPLDGVEAELFFPGGASDPRNRALIEFRNAIAALIASTTDQEWQIHQWPRNIET